MIRNNYITFHRLLAAFCAGCVSVATQAQEGNYLYQDATQLWRLTDNAAGLGLDNSRNRGYAEFRLEHSEGDYRRVQEGGQRNQLQFFTERYQHIGRFLMGYGRFLFDMDRTKDRAWCDVMRPYDSNPFYSGSSVRGKYDTQQFDLSAAVSTIPIPLAGGSADRELTAGVRLDYKVGDLSRLRDPRSRSELLDYMIAPGVTFTFGRNAIGLAGHYDRRKEKIPNMTTVQQDPNLMYYQMTGLNSVTGTIGGYSGYQREWVNHRLGAELNFGINSSDHGANGDYLDDEGDALLSGIASLNTIGISRGKEDVWGQYKYSPGQYTTYIYKAASHNRIGTRRWLHAIDLEAKWQQGYADEKRQQLVQDKDPDKGYTSYRYETQIEYKKRYQVKTYDVSLHYRLNNVAGKKTADGPQGGIPHHVVGYAGAVVQLTGSSNKHLLPTSELKHQRMNFTLEGGQGLLKGHLWLEAAATYSYASKADLMLADTGTNGDASVKYANEVLVPDMEYYDANYRRGQLSLKYLFPLKLKGIRSSAYVKAYGEIIKAQHSMDRKTVGVTFGLFN